MVRETSDIDMVTDSNEMSWDGKTPDDGTANQQNEYTGGKGPNVTLVSLPPQVSEPAK